MTELNNETNWRRRLAGDKVDTFADEPAYGFYRVREHKGGRFVPIAYWYTEGGELRCKLNGILIDNDRAREIWPFASENPIAHDVYLKVLNGFDWPDIDKTVAEQVNGRGIGDNNPPTDPVAVLKEQIESAQASVDQYKEIADDETAAKAQSLRARLLELRGVAEKSHKKEKDPHLEAGRAVDRKWFPLRDLAEAGANAIRRALQAHEDRKLQARRKAEAEAQRIANEAMRKAAEDAAKAAKKGKPAVVPEPVPPPPPAPPPQTQIKGAYGKAASIGIKRVAVIVDQDKVYAAFKTRADVLDVLQRCAQQAIDAGYAVDGVNIEEKSNVR